MRRRWPSFDWARESDEPADVEGEHVHVGAGVLPLERPGERAAALGERQVSAHDEGVGEPELHGVRDLPLRAQGESPRSADRGEHGAVGVIHDRAVEGESAREGPCGYGSPLGPGRDVPGVLVRNRRGQADRVRGVDAHLHLAVLGPALPSEVRHHRPLGSDLLAHSQHEPVRKRHAQVDLRAEQPRLAQGQLETRPEARPGGRRREGQVDLREPGETHARALHRLDEDSEVAPDAEGVGVRLRLPVREAGKDVVHRDGGALDAPHEIQAPAHREPVGDLVRGGGEEAHPEEQPLLAVVAPHPAGVVLQRRAEVLGDAQADANLRRDVGHEEEAASGEDAHGVPSVAAGGGRPRTRGEGEVSVEQLDAREELVLLEQGHPGGVREERLGVAGARRVAGRGEPHARRADLVQVEAGRPRNRGGGEQKNGDGHREAAHEVPR